MPHTVKEGKQQNMLKNHQKPAQTAADQHDTQIKQTLCWRSGRCLAGVAFSV